MSDDLVGVRWMEFDPVTGKFRAGEAFEDGTGWHIERDLPSVGEQDSAFSSGVKMGSIMATKHE